MACDDQPLTSHVVQTARQAITTPERKRLHWWKEALIMVTFYVLYSFARNQFGSAVVATSDEPVQAFTNAIRVIDLERALGLFHEEAIQDLFLPHQWFIRFWNVFYGTFHFVVTIGAFVALFLLMPARFTRFRNTLGFTTAFAIIGFSLFPLMPPRLLNDDGPYGGERIAEQRGIENFGFTDTLEKVGGLWNFDSGAVAKLSNQYAAMPSLHCAWALWCTLALWPLARRWWSRALLIVYPVCTLFCIIVTANHFWLDGVGGALTLFVGYQAGAAFDRWNDRRVLRRLPST